MLPSNLARICQRWRLEAISELTDLLGLLVSGDFDQNDYCDRISGLADHAKHATDATDRTTPRLRTWKFNGEHPLKNVWGQEDLIDDTTRPEDLQP